MRSDSDLHEPRTNAEHRETGDDLRVSFESLDFPERWELCKKLVERERLAALGDLYFIRCGDAVKIGHTNNIVNRLANMQVNSPHEIDCLLLLKGRGREEKEWHRRFASDRIRGEWFRLSPELEATVLQEREKYRLALNCSPSDNLSGDGSQANRQEAV